MYGTATATATETGALTKYERTKVIGLRAEQIARGSEPLVDVPEPSPGQPPLGPCEIAERELDSRRLPMIVVRQMPDGKKVHIRLS